MTIVKVTLSAPDVEQSALASRILTKALNIAVEQSIHKYVKAIADQVRKIYPHFSVTSETVDSEGQSVEPQPKDLLTILLENPQTRGLVVQQVLDRHGGKETRNTGAPATEPLADETVRELFLSINEGAGEILSKTRI